METDGGSEPCEAAGEPVPRGPSEADAVAQPTARWTLRSLLGVGLLVLSWALWLAVPVGPFLPLSVAGRTSVVGAALLAAELAFWLGLLLMGPELAEVWRRWFPSGWWRMLWKWETNRKRDDARQ